MESNRETGDGQLERELRRLLSSRDRLDEIHESVEELTQRIDAVHEHHRDEHARTTANDFHVRELKPQLAELTRAVGAIDARLETLTMASKAMEPLTEDHLYRTVVRPLAQRLGGVLDITHDAGRRGGPCTREIPERELVDAVRAMIEDALTTLGVIVLPSHPGDAFNPEHMQAVRIVDVRDANRDGTVISVVTQGLRHGDRIVRPAAVEVARWNEPTARNGQTTVDVIRKEVSGEHSPRY